MLGRFIPSGAWCEIYCKFCWKSRLITSKLRLTLERITRFKKLNIEKSQFQAISSSGDFQDYTFRFFWQTKPFYPGDWRFFKIWEYFPGDRRFSKIWGFLSRGLRFFQNLGIYIPGIFIPGDWGFSQIWGFLSRDFWKSGDFYRRGFRQIPGIGDFLVIFFHRNFSEMGIFSRDWISHKKATSGSRARNTRS